MSRAVERAAYVAIGIVLAASLAFAQQASFAPPLDTSKFATSSAVSSLASSVATLQSAAPSPCAATPLPDTLNGALGTGTPCMLRPDTARPTVVQAANIVTDASGNWTVTWAKPFASTTPSVNPLPVNTGALPIMCNVQTRSASSAAGRCWQANTNTLPGTLVALGGLILNGFSSGAGNAAVMVIAREPTQ